jgi:hypothetical protein
MLELTIQKVAIDEFGRSTPDEFVGTAFDHPEEIAERQHKTTSSGGGTTSACCT